MSPEREPQRLVAITLDEKTLVRRQPEAEHERAIAIYDLLEENFFRLVGDFTGPYCLVIRLEENRLVLDVSDQAGGKLAPQDKEWFLANIETDAGERTNLLAKHPELFARLRKLEPGK